MEAFEGRMRAAIHRDNIDRLTSPQNYMRPAGMPEHERARLTAHAVEHRAVSAETKLQVDRAMGLVS